MLEVQSHIPNNDPAQSWLDEYWTMLYVAAEIAPYTTVHKKKQKRHTCSQALSTMETLAGWRRGLKEGSEEIIEWESLAV